MAVTVSLTHVREAASVSFTMTACRWRHVGMHSIASCRLVREYDHVQLYKWVLVLRIPLRFLPLLPHAQL